MTQFMCVSSAEYTEDYIYMTRGEYRCLCTQLQCMCLKAGKDLCVHVNVCRSGLPDLRCLHCC